MGKKVPILNILILLALLVSVRGPGAAGPVEAQRESTAGEITPQLAALANEDPQAQVRVIVQKTGEERAAEQLVSAMGGEIIHELEMMNAFAARLPAGQLTRLAGEAAVLRISPDAPVRSLDTVGQTPQIILRADFDRPSYADELSSWPGEWQEIGEGDGPRDGMVVIEDFMAGMYRGVRLMGSGMGIQSHIDLSRAQQAVLSLSFRRKDFSDTDQVALEISLDGSQWNRLDTFTGPALDPDLITYQYDLSAFPQEIDVRLTSELSDAARFYLDFLQIDYITTPKPAPDLPYKVHIPFMSGPQIQVQAAPVIQSELAAQSLYSSGTLLDKFNTAAYANNDGLIPWAGPWIEQDAAGAGPTAGHIQILAGELRFNNDPSAAAMPGIERAADLTNGVTGAVLSFNYRTYMVEANQDRIAVEVSGDDGQTFHTLEVLETDKGSVEGSRRYDISTYTDGITRVRFRVAGGYSDSAEYFYLKEVRIAYTTSGAQTVRDEFNATSYSNQDGITTWNSSWIEYDPDGGNGAAGGYVSASEGRLRFYWTWSEYILRQVNLKGAARATLTFDWETTGLDEGESISVLASMGGGAAFTQLGSFEGSGKGSAVYDLTPFISSETILRFDSLDENWDYGEYAYFDNIQITYASPCQECMDTFNLESAFIPAVGANKLWNEAPYLQGQDVTVAVVDSGVANHPDFLNAAGASRLLTHVSFATGSELPDDFYGHGTHIAGLIAGNGAASGGAYIGVAPRANLVDIKVLDDLGRGYTSDVVAGLEWLYENADAYSIQVVNLSLNSTLEESYRYNALSAALEMLWFRGITVIVAAGNNQDGTDAGVLFPPANDPYLISVGAVDDQETAATADDALAPFSAFGLTLDGHSKPDLVAPGSDIVSLMAGDDSNLVIDHPDHLVTAPNGSKLFRMSGTSMAAPIVSGAAALLLQSEPGLSPDQVKARLMETSRPFAAGNGAGILNIFEAVQNPTQLAAQSGEIPNDLLAKMALIAYWASTKKNTTIDWDNVDWETVNWEAVDWDAVDWSTVDWGSVNWGSVNWGSVNWGSVNWGSVNWGSVNWGSVNWGSVNWGSDHWDEIP